MSRFLVIEFPGDVQGMDLGDAVATAIWKFVDGEDEAQKEAERLGLEWPAYMVRTKLAAIFTVRESVVEDWDEYARELVRLEVDRIKNPPTYSGCGCGILSGLLERGCGCGPSCRCGKS